MQKITTSKELKNILGKQYIILFLDYVNQYINTTTFQNTIYNELTKNKDLIGLLLDNHFLLYSQHYIALDKKLLNSLLVQLLKQLGITKNYSCELTNFGFRRIMHDICNLSIYNDTRSNINNRLELIYKLFQKKNVQQNQKLDYRIIKHKNELAAINDIINSKYKITDPEADPHGTTVLYINGTLLQGNCTHDTLLDEYYSNYNLYKDEGKRDLSNIILKQGYLDWEDLNRLNISAARLYSYSYGISELFLKYGNDDLKALCNEIYKKLKQKIYTFQDYDGLTVRLARTYKF